MSSPAVQLRSRMPRIAPYIGGAAMQKARLRLVPRRAPKHTRIPFMALVSLVLLGGVIGLLLFNTSMQQAAFATTALESQAGTLAARQQTLEMELDVLRNPQRVAERAKSMGMVPGGTPAYLLLPTGKVLGQPTPATAENGIRLEALAAPKPPILDPDPIVRLVNGDGPAAQSLGHSLGHPLAADGGRPEGRPVTGRDRD